MMLNIFNITQTQQGLPIATIPKSAIDISRKLHINKKVNKSHTHTTEPVLPPTNLNPPQHTTPLDSGLQTSDIPCPNQPLLPNPNPIPQTHTHQSQPTPIEHPIQTPTVNISIPHMQDSLVYANLDQFDQQFCGH